MAHELVLTRLIDVPRETLWRCWTEPKLIVQWFTPPPWQTVHAETDVRPGGSSTFHQGWGIATDQMTALAKTL